MQLYAPYKFYTARVCPFSQRVSVTLHELGLITTIAQGSQGQVEIHEIDLKNKPASFLKDINPQGKVPVLQITSATQIETLTESAKIAEFLLHVYQDRAALLSNALDWYKASMFVDTFTDLVTKQFYTVLKEQDASKHAGNSAQLLTGIRKVQDLLSPNLPFALGDTFTIADILTAPFLARFPVIQHYRGFVVPDTDEFARFNAWSKALIDRSSVKDTLPAREYLVEQYNGYANPEM